MIGYFAEVEPSGRYVQCISQELPSVELPSPGDPNNALHPVAAPPASWNGATPTEVLYLVDGVEVWEETAVLADIKAAATAKTFADVDAVIWDAVGNRTREYELAEQAARAFAAAGYQGEVSRLVTAYALNNPTMQEQSNEWAAQNIIARASAFDWATEEMRDKRMYYGVRMQSAATHTELAAAVSGWDDFIAGLRAQLGLQPQGEA